MPKMVYTLFFDPLLYSIGGRLVGVITISKNVRKKLFEKPWAVFCKVSFSNKNVVLEYIGRYSHRSDIRL